MSGPFYVSYVALWVLVIFQSLLGIGLVRALYKTRAVEEEVEEPNVKLQGEPVPPFATEDVFGVSISSRDFAGRPMALLFVSPDCSTCAVTLKELAALKSKTQGNLVLFCMAAHNRCVTLAEHYKLSAPVICDADRRFSDLLGITVPPTAVLISEDGLIESYGHPGSADQLRDLITVTHVNGRPEGDRDAREPVH
jgi:peroxiredoxin